MTESFDVIRPLTVHFIIVFKVESAEISLLISSYFIDLRIINWEMSSPILFVVAGDLVGPLIWLIFRGENPLSLYYELVAIGGEIEPVLFPSKLSCAQ